MAEITTITREDILLNHVGEHLGKLDKLNNAHTLGHQFALGLPAIIADDVAAMTEELEVEVEESAAIGKAMVEAMRNDGPLN